jgi:hypothetical protein
MAVLPLLGVDVEAINKFIPTFSKAGCGLSHLAAAQCLLAAHDRMGVAKCFTSTLRGSFRLAAQGEDTIHWEGGRPRRAQNRQAFLASLAVKGVFNLSSMTIRLFSGCGGMTHTELVHVYYTEVQYSAVQPCFYHPPPAAGCAEAPHDPACGIF